MFNIRTKQLRVLTEDMVLENIQHLQETRIPFKVQNDIKSNQGNQSFSGNQKNGIQGQRPDMENRHTQQRTKNYIHTYKVTKANDQL